jgi:hypothetical protein
MENQKQIEFLKLINIKHSGTGENATHIKVIDAFSKSIQEGKRYCDLRGWKVNIDTQKNILSITSNNVFGFEMFAKINII